MFCFSVDGEPVIEKSKKVGFKQLQVIKELQPEKVFQWRYEEAVNPIHPFLIEPPEIKDKHIELLRKCISIHGLIQSSSWIPDSIFNPVKIPVKKLVWDRVGKEVWNLVGNSILGSVWDSVWNPVEGPFWDSIGDPVGDSIGESIWDSILAYIKYIIRPVVFGQDDYQHQPFIDLWKQGLVPSFDRESWRLHGGKEAKTLWKGML